MRITRTRATVLASLAALTLVAAACGDDDNAGATPATTAAAAAAAPTTGAGSTPMSSTPMSSTPMTGDAAMMAPSGPGCSSVPTSGAGSFAGMAKDPAATAASHNPQLSTLVAAVQAAGLVDTLNGAGPFTIFAPINSAFEKIPKADLDKVLADKGTLTSILTYHVVAGRMSSADLAKAGTLTTVNGAQLKIAMTGDALSINGGVAKVVCQDVPTANATVYLIDSVLMPPA